MSILLCSPLLFCFCFPVSASGRPTCFILPVSNGALFPQCCRRLGADGFYFCVSAWSLCRSFSFSVSILLVPIPVSISIRTTCAMCVLPPPHLIVCISRLQYLSQSARSRHSIVLLFLIMTLLLLYDVDDMMMMSTRTELLKDTDTKNYVRTYTLCWLSHNSYVHV